MYQFIEGVYYTVTTALLIYFFISFHKVKKEIANKDELATALEKLTVKNKEIIRENELYKSFFEEIYLYQGSYPNWKAEQEFRSFIEGTKFPIPDKEQKKKDVLSYITKVVDATAVLLKVCPSAAEGKTLHFWEDGELPSARGVKK